MYSTGSLCQNDDDHDSLNSVPHIGVPLKLSDFDCLLSGEELRAQIKEREDRRRFEDSLVRLRSAFHANTVIANQCSIRRFVRMKQALEVTQNKAGLVLFACDKPKPKPEEMIMKYTKEYLVGRVTSFFKYAHSVEEGVALDEVVQAWQPFPVHFNIELKISPSIPPRIEEVLQGHINVHGPSGIDADVVRDVVTIYSELSKTAFGEAVCKAGYDIITAFIIHAFN